MFFFNKYNSELEGIIARIENNMANNYKDNAQEALRDFEKRLPELIESKKLNPKQQKHYGDILYSYQDRMKEFTHKDQKPYWT